MVEREREREREGERGRERERGGNTYWKREKREREGSHTDRKAGGRDSS